MPYCGTATKWSKIGLVTQYIGLALFLSGFGTIGWMATLTVQNSKDIIVGLFRMIDCSTGSCSTQDISTDYENSTHFDELINWYFITSKAHINLSRKIRCLKIVRIFLLFIYLFFFYISLYMFLICSEESRILSRFLSQYATIFFKDFRPWKCKILS